MAGYIKTIKQDTDVIYPVTTAEAVIGLGAGGYSTEEAITGSTWVDGSPIFKRSYYVSAGPAAGGTATISFDSSVNLVIRVEGYLSNGVNEFPIPTARNTTETQIGMFVSLQNHNVVLEASYDRTGYSGYITLWYTKS